MTYPQLIERLVGRGYTRIERDDRLFDIFPDQILEKGIELWEQWDADTVHIVRIKVPFVAQETSLYHLSRQQHEQDLFTNTRRYLTKHRPVARGEGVLVHI